mgnify:CR=1 FL=1
MGNIIGTVYNVRRRNATKSATVGDYNTLDEAQSAMMQHYQNTPKRGNFQYIINEENLEDFGGTVMRVFNITLSGKGNFYHVYTRAELDNAIKEATA